MEQDKKTEVLEILDSAQYNVGNAQKVGVGLLPLVRKQILEAIKTIDPEYEPLI